MKWLPEHLFKYQFIRPKKHFRGCYYNCKSSSSKKFSIVEHTSYDKSFSQILSWCRKCGDLDNDYSVTMPSYLIDYNLLLGIHSDLNNKDYIKTLDSDKLNSLISYYKELKYSINNDPYFKHLKRVNNRLKLNNNKKKKS